MAMFCSVLCASTAHASGISCATRGNRRALGTSSTSTVSPPAASLAVGGLTVLVELVPSARRFPRVAQDIPEACAVDAHKTEQNIAILMPSCDKSLPKRERRRHHPLFFWGGRMLLSAVCTRVQAARHLIGNRPCEALL